MGKGEKRKKGREKMREERRGKRGRYVTVSAIFAVHWRGPQHRGACHHRTCSEGLWKIPPIIIVVLCSNNNTSYRLPPPLATLSTTHPPFDGIATTALIVPSNACSFSCWHCHHCFVAVVVTAAVAASTYVHPCNECHRSISAGARGVVSDGGHGRSHASSPPLRFATRLPQHMLIVTPLFKPDTNALVPWQRHTQYYLHAPTTPSLPQQPNGTPATLIITPRHCRPAATPAAPPHQTHQSPLIFVP